MSLCILAAGQVTMLAASLFSLSWVHSVEGTRWEERWRVGGSGLEILEARIKGSGAGMEPGEGARLRDGWWTYRPRLPVQRRLVLAASGTGPGGWTLCTVNGCRRLGHAAGPPITIMPCTGPDQSVGVR
jgi:hypothetical protein